MDVNLIDKQTKLDIERGRFRFLCGHALTIVAALFAGAVIFGLYYLSTKMGWLGMKETTVKDLTTYSLAFNFHGFQADPRPLESIFLVFVVILIFLLFVFGPLQLVLFGVTYKYPLKMAYRGRAKAGQFFYGFNLTGYIMMRALLYPLVLGLIAMGPLVLSYIISIVLTLVGLGLVGTLLVWLSVLWMLIALLKYALVPFFLADDKNSTMTLWGAFKASWKATTFPVVWDWIMLNVAHRLKYLLVFLPFIVCAGALIIKVFEIKQVADILGLQMLQSLPLDIPELPSLMPKNLPSLSFAPWLNLTVAAIASAASFVICYIIYVLFVKCRMLTAQANFYNEAKLANR